MDTGTAGTGTDFHTDRHQYWYRTLGNFGTIWIPLPPVPVQTFIPVPETSVFGKFGTTSTSVPDTLVSLVRHQYRYLRYRYRYNSWYRYRYNIDTGTGQFGKLGCLVEKNTTYMKRLGTSLRGQTRVSQRRLGCLIPGPSEVHSARRQSSSRRWFDFSMSKNQTAESHEQTNK